MYLISASLISTNRSDDALDYRYVYGNDRLSVNITGVAAGSSNLVENRNQIRLYYHMDYLGTTDYLTSPVSLKVTNWTHYNEWGQITHNAVLKCGQRELDLVKRFATHDYDAVLNMYYAKARFYDAENRRFAAVDSVKGYITEPMSMVQYLYVVDAPLTWVDPLGLEHALFEMLLGGSAKTTVQPTTNQNAIPTVDAPIPTQVSPEPNIEVPGVKAIADKPNTQHVKKISVGDSISSYASGFLTAAEEAAAPTVGMALQGAVSFYNYWAPHAAYIPTNGYDIYNFTPANSYNVYTPIINSGDIYGRVVGYAQGQSQIAAQNAANPKAFYAGRVDGDTVLFISSVAGIYTGVEAMFTGAGITGTGLAAAPSGGGALVAAGGAAMATVGGAIAVGSAQIAVTAANNLYDDAQKKEYYDKAGCEGSGGTRDSKVDYDDDSGRKITKSDHAQKRQLEGRNVNRTINDLNRARPSDIYPR